MPRPCVHCRLPALLPRTPQVRALPCDAYRTWVHAPVHGAPRFFADPALEACTRTPWWLVPVLWLPLAAALAAPSAAALGAGQAIALLAGGVLTWHVLEYAVHRWVFHGLLPRPGQGAGGWRAAAHFALHGCHHKAREEVEEGGRGRRGGWASGWARPAAVANPPPPASLLPQFPEDEGRLVFPPLPAAFLAAGVRAVLGAALPPAAATVLFAGGLCGYVAYDVGHYWMHHQGLKGSGRSAPRWARRLRALHLAHHTARPDALFGISSSWVDALCGTDRGRLRAA